MPFQSKQQSKACFATGGFGGKVDCEEWAGKTNYKSLPRKKSFKEWLLARETGASAGVPYVGQAPDPGGEMSWQGAAGGGVLHSAKGNIPVKKQKKK